MLEVERVGGGGGVWKLLKFPNRSPHIPELRFMHSICGCYQLSFCLSAGRISGFWIVRISEAAFLQYRAVCCQLSYCPLVGSLDFWVSVVLISVAAFTVQSCLLSAVILPVGWLSWILGFQLSGYLWQYLQSCQLSPFLLSSLYLGWKLPVCMW